MRALKTLVWLCSLVSLMMIAAFVISDEARADLKDDLVSVWKFDEGKGDVAHDSVGNNDGIIDGAEWVDGEFGMALDFNGEDDGVEIPDDPSLQLPDALTVACWIYPRATKDAAGNDHAGVVWKGSKIGWGTDVYNWRIATSGDAGLTFGACGGGVESHFKDANCFVNGLNNWYHVAYTADGSIGRAYVNGVEVGNRADAISYDVIADQPVRIGWAEGRGSGDGVSVYFDGIIDDVAIYSRALNAKEIKELMEQGAPGSRIPQPEDSRKPEEHGVPSGSSVATWGAAKNTTLVYIQEQSVDVNKTFSVDVRASHAKNIAGFQVSLHYDPYYLQFVRAQEGKALLQDGGTTFWRNPDVNTEAGTIIGAASTRMETGGVDFEDDVLVTFTFETKELGRTMISLQDVKLSNPESELIPLLFSSAFITISPPWDVVADAVIDIRDMVAVGQNLSNHQLLALLAERGDVEAISDSDTYNPDADRNGVVDVNDLILVSSHFGETYIANAVQQSPVAELQRIYSRVNTAPYNSPDIRKFKTHLKQLIAMDRAKSPPVMSRLLPNYPNPFNPNTWIPYELAQDNDVTISIYGVSGELVRMLNLGYKEAGSYMGKDKAVYWNGSNNSGEKTASGVYFYVIRAGDFTATRKMLLQN